MRPHHGEYSSIIARLWLLVLLLHSAGAWSADWRWQGVSRVVALSDIHGAFDALQRTLRASDVIDEAGKWSGGDTHLVITGDILDRGPASRSAMDLLMRLESEASAAGGRVHVLLGNHEVMNLVGDLRYVALEEYAAFAADEPAELRDYWRARFIARATTLSSESTLAEQFDKAHPPGFFAHRQAFSVDGAYGRWLMSKPVVIVINDTAFVHGGLAPEMAGYGLDGLNKAVRERLAAYMNAVAVLNDAGVLHPGDAFYAHRKILEESMSADEHGEAVLAAAATVSGEPPLRLDALDGPLWYRGNVSCTPLAETGRLSQVLEKLGAERLVIGHTPTASREVVQRLGGRILEIDTGMLNRYYGGSGRALVLSGKDLSVTGEQGPVPGVPDDPRPFGHNDKSREAIEALLTTGAVTLGDRREDGWTGATVSAGDDTVTALFRPLRSKRSAPGVAAYRVDRLLDLQMVPVAVRREIDGRRGELQHLPQGTVNEAQRQAQQAGHGAWCPLPVQWNAMYVFDTLIQNEVRAQQHMQYSRESWQLFLTHHEGAFGTRSATPRYLEGATLDVHAAWRAALSRLDENTLEENLGDVLDKRQQRALLRRRDRMLE